MLFCLFGLFLLCQVSFSHSWVLLAYHKKLNSIFGPRSGLVPHLVQVINLDSAHVRINSALGLVALVVVLQSFGGPNVVEALLALHRSHARAYTYACYTLY
jgi:hypothetical protein